MVDEAESTDANEQSGPSEETKAEQRRTAKERRGRVEATKAALEASEVRAKLDSTERLLKEVIGHQTAGDDDKVQEAIREHEQRAVSIKSQVEYKRQMDEILLGADMEWEDEEITSSDFNTKWEAGDLAGALGVVQKIALPTAQSAEEQSAQVQELVRKEMAKLGVKVDDGGVSTGTGEVQPVTMYDIVVSPQGGKEAMSTVLDDYYKGVEKKG